MTRRPPGQGWWSSQHGGLLIILAVYCIPILQLAHAQQQRIPALEPRDALPGLRHDGGSQPAPQDAAVYQFEATVIDDSGVMHTRPSTPKRQSHVKHEKRDESVVDALHGQSSLDKQPRPQKHKLPNLNDYENIIIPNDASALATLAPASSVRAPHPLRHQNPSSIPASGLSSPHVARSLEDWEVEDFVLMATVDGDLYANDRKTGKELWHLEVDQPMVETKHHRPNSSALDEDYNPMDHYIWVVEPNRDGGLYWIPDSKAGLVRTGFTMKSLVELAPFSSGDPPIVYTGDKKTTLITLDAATGKVLKWFGSSGSHVNEAERCLRPDTLHGMDSTLECSSTGTVTLGRTEYTVGIQRPDGRPIATLKYAEWGPNNFDHDLYGQYYNSLDSRYITTRHDGKVYGFDYNRAEGASPIFSHKFAEPVAKVFDVCRPRDAPPDSNPELIILPQPPLPSSDKEGARVRSNRVFLNQTGSDGWYALSGLAYPLITDAPTALLAMPEWLDLAPPLENIEEGQLSKALIGNHFLESSSGPNNPPTLPGSPAGAIGDGHKDLENESAIPIHIGDDGGESTIIEKVKLIPKSAAKNVVDFVSNPILIILFIVGLVYNEKKLRRAYRAYRERGFSQEHDLWHALGFTGDVGEGDSVDMGKGDFRPTPKGTSGRAAKREVVATASAISQAGDQLEPAATEATPAETAPNEALTVSVEVDAKTVNDSKASSDSVESPGDASAVSAQNSSVPEKKKGKSHRGQRGGVKHRKKRARDSSKSPEENATDTVDEAVSTAKRLGGEPAALEPDVMTVTNDMQAIGGPIIRMGNIEVNTELQLGTGSNGTLVFAGKFDGRDVAVKRMLIHFYDIASQETRLLRESDDHPNVIRYYSQQIQDGFLYIALERCAASLADVVEKPHFFRELATAGKQELPSVLYQIANGISHLHNLRIVHRDLKPQNILVNLTKDGKPRMLVSDFGLCKKLEGGQSSFGATTGRAAGTSGWRAPELLLDDDARDAGIIELSTHSGSGSVLVNDSMMSNGRRATRAIDIFSLGLVFFYVLTNGSHPFDCGDRYMREVNIRKGNYNLQLLDSLGDFAYEARDLISSMLESDPKRRPPAVEVMSHPFFWSAKKRLAFLCDVSDHFEKEPRDPPSPALAELERHAPGVTKGDFLRLLPREFVDSLGKQRKYTGSKLLDLLRALRNKRNHYEDMPDNLKRVVGSLPDGYLSFWTVRFPSLLLDCWNVVYNVRWEETDRFKEYYEPAGL